MSDVVHLRLVVVGHCVRDERRKWTLWLILLYQKKKLSFVQLLGLMLRMPH